MKSSMSRIFAIAIAGCLSLQAPSFAENSLPYEQHEDVVVCQSPHGIAITMDVFKPTGESNGIGIIDVASGGWSSDRGKIRDHKRAKVYDIFCKRGYTMFAIRPGSSSRFSAHDMVRHLETAIEEIQKSADEYGIDPDRISITGASAGGHLASLVAVRGEAKVVGAGVFFPPTDFLSFGNASDDPERVNRFARNLAFKNRAADPSPEKVKELLKEISPAHLVTKEAPPFMIIHGDADKIVPLSQSETLLAALKEKGVPAELIVKPGGGHPWLTINEEVAKMADWFDKLYAPEPAVAN